jgi:hypothetical protein
MTKTSERRLENNMTGFKLATSVGGYRPASAATASTSVIAPTEVGSLSPA